MRLYLSDENRLELSEEYGVVIDLHVKDICTMFGTTAKRFHRYMHRWQNGPTESRKRREERDRTIMDAMKSTMQKLSYVPGRRVFRAFLWRDFSMTVSEKKIAKLMRRMNLSASRPHKDAYKGQATYMHRCYPVQNRIRRRFRMGPRQVILTDITYLYYGKDRTVVYLCVFRDAFTGEILGYCLSRRMDVEIIKEAYLMMMKTHGSEFASIPSVYIHSDQGSQYLSAEFQQMMSDDEFIQSVSRRGNSQDNAPMESFFGRMKTVILDLFALSPNFITCRRLIEGFMFSYNNEFYQYGLGCLTPAEFYDYCMTGVYPAEEYFGVDKDSLYSPKDLEYLRRRSAAEKQKARERRRRVSDELSSLEGSDEITSAEKIVLKDMKKFNGMIARCEQQIAKLKERKQHLEDLYRMAASALDFIREADEGILEDLQKAANWQNYKELEYVKKTGPIY